MTLQKLLILLLALLITGALIGGAFWYTLHYVKPAPDDWSAVDNATSTAQNMRDPSPSEHILGNPNAPLVFITYSDFQCPYCKEYHATMRLIMDTYGKDGAVAIIHRHMPLTQMHTQSATYALASECVADLAGNTAFWNFAEKLFASSTPTDTANSAMLIALAKEVGVSDTAFTTCMQDNSRMERVNRDYKEAIDAGARATPFTVLITPHQKIVLEEARPYPVVAASIEQVLHAFGYDAHGKKI